MRPIDADKLMESIRKALGIKSMTKSLLLPAKRTIIDQIDSAPTVGGWIRVKDRLPEPDSYRCPNCGAENPERFFLQSGDIVGCSDCIDDEQSEDVVYKYPWLFDGYRGED